MNRNPTRWFLRRMLIGGLAWLGLASGLVGVGVAHGDDLWDIYQIALTHDAQYRATDYAYQRAQLALPLAKAARRPTLTVQGTGGRLRDDRGGEYFTSRNNQLNLNARLPLYDRALRSQVTRAEWEVARAEIRFDEAQDRLILRVAENYFQWLAALDGKEVAERQRAALQRQMDFTEQRLAVGLGTLTDLFDAQARFQQAVADAIQADHRIHNAAQALKQLLGNPPETLATLADDAPLQPPAPQVVQHWIAAALENNTALRGADFDLKIADQAITQQRAARLPRIGLNLNQQRRDSNSNDFVPTGANSTALNATLTWQLYGGGAFQTKVKQAALQFNATEQNKEALRRQVEADATAAYLAATGGLDQVRALSEAVRAGASALQGKEEGFRAGLTTNLDVLDAQRDLSRSRTAYLRVKYDFIMSLLRLEQVVGDLDEDDLQRINAWLTHE